MRTSCEVIEKFMLEVFNCWIGGARMEVLNGRATLEHPDGSIDYLIAVRRTETRPDPSWSVSQHMRLAVERH